MLLERCSALVLVVLGKPFLGARFVTDAAGSAAEGHVAVAGDEASIDTLAILEGVVDVAAVHMHDGGVVVEVVAAPLAAGKADPAVAEAVVDAAVVADVAAPVAFMENIPAPLPAPVRRRPQGALIRGGDPGAGNPVVAALNLVVGPVTGSPHRARLRAVGLLINGQGRRRKAHADQDARIRGCGDEHKYHRQQKPTRKE
jgi:hypothetical protein